MLCKVESTAREKDKNRWLQWGWLDKKKTNKNSSESKPNKTKQLSRESFSTQLVHKLINVEKFRWVKIRCQELGHAFPFFINFIL